MASGTLFSNTEVIGGMINGPASPTGSISAATVNGAAVEGTMASSARPRSHQDEPGGDDAAGAEPFCDPRAERGEDASDEHHRDEDQAGLEGGQAV